MRISDWSSDVCSSDLLVLTQEVAGGGDGEPLKVSETIMRNLRVLATDQRTDPVGEDGKREVMTYSNVTLEVTPQKIGRATCRERVCQCVEIPVVAVSFTKQQ